MGKWSMTSLISVRSYQRSRRAPAGVVGEPLAVGARRSRDHPVALAGREAPLAGDDVQAGGEALDVPLPWARQRLVKVVDVEHERSLGAGELPEVADVGVAARLHPKPGDRVGREVHRHDGGSPSEEGERRFGHASVADWDQFGNLETRPGLRGPRWDRAGAAAESIRRGRIS